MFLQDHQIPIPLLDHLNRLIVLEMTPKGAATRGDEFEVNVLRLRSLEHRKEGCANLPGVTVSNEEDSRNISRTGRQSHQGNRKKQ